MKSRKPQVRKPQDTQPRADWRLQPRGPWSAAGLSGLALAVAATIGHEIGVDPLWAVGAGTIATVGTLAVHRDLGPAPLWYRMGCAIGAGSWLTWGLASGIWNGATMGALGLGLLGAAVFAPIANRPPKPRPSVTGSLDRDRPIGKSVVVRRHVAQAEEWVARIRRVAKIRVQILEFREWSNRYGFSMLLQQPLGASTTTRLVQAAVGLAEDNGLDHGCGVEFMPGPRRGTLWMHVATVNGLAETIPHPGIRLGGSISDPDAIRLGQHRDGKTTTVALRESTMVVAGQKRSGKTGTLHDITADAGALDDTIVFHMDLNGGGVSRAWLRPWLQGRTRRPTIDWAASCPEEALLMAHALVAIAKDRKSTTTDLKAEADVQLLPVSRDLPAILLILDEGKEVLGQKVTDPVVRQIRRLLETLVDIGGNEACNAVLSVLRSTSNTLSTEILKQCSTRATMRVFDQSELDYLFGYRKGITPQDAPEQGSGFLAAGPGGPRPFKAFFMKPSDIDAAAVAIAEHRPDLDAAAVEAAGEAYASRYERMRYLYATPAQQATMTPPEPVVLPGFEGASPWYPAGNDPEDGQEETAARLPIRRAPGTVARRSHLRLLPSEGITSGWGDLDRRRPATRPTPAAPAARAEARPAMVRAEHVTEISDGGHPVPELLERALQLRWDGGRMHSVRLAEQLGMSEHELAALLGALGVATLPNAFERGGVRRRGYERQALVDAASAVRAGELEVPPEVAAWTAA
ncbi:hypothetical protein [Nonomuraea sp. GTA35]|uniref:hypothetical protein n=1 Tax=Nonomuraea sp. GTA35 TaxID=1676746 RepID=UPI0035C211E2